ncbi:MAG: L,D-transpeptidase family protein [Deltaproteobacteria bacterium]|nr:L,D-transpeptidase family protein [Deltaproteobacteria bacterium]
MPSAPLATDVPNTTPPTAQPSEQPPSVKALPPPKFLVGEDILSTATMLARFYEGRNYRPAWSDDSGPLPRAETLLQTIRAQAGKEGLRAEDYRLAQLGKLLRQASHTTPGQPSADARALTDLDFLLTDTFLLYGTRLSIGKPTFNALRAEWFEQQQKTDLVHALQDAVETDRVDAALTALVVRHPGYTQLREALAHHRAVAERGGWPRVSAGFDLRPGDRDRRVAQLRARLQATGELASESTTENTRTNAPNAPAHKAEARKSNPGNDEEYNASLEVAVKKFQQRHGLEPDGVVGGGTLAALNVSVETRIQQILANMDRWRALPRNLGGRYVAINVANFTLDVVEKGQSALHMKVVVGKMMEKRSTPTFSAPMTHIVLNPYWHVPKSIAEEELFPLSRKDPKYFAKNKFTVRKVAVGEKLIPDPNATDGSLIATTVYQYRLRQEPGPKNALGRVKFIFPNAHGVYLHDTPSKALFDRAVRTFSHGCIRVERPIDLAEHLLHDSAKWTRDDIQTTLDRLKEKTVWLPEPVPVYIQYWTAWVDRDGIMQFRNDIYGYDNTPGAQLPVTVAKKPRPAPTPQIPQILLEPQSPQPAPQDGPPASSVPLETRPALPVEPQHTL